jgi:hypothetical protein
VRTSTARSRRPTRAGQASSGRAHLDRWSAVRRPVIRMLALGLCVTLMAVAAGLAALYGPGARPADRHFASGAAASSDAVNAFAAYSFVPRSLQDLLSATPARLAECDIARMNLVCAEGLPGSENLDIDERLATLDRWAEKVRFETQRHLYRAHDPQWAEHYRHSASYVKAEFLAQVLQQDCGAHYNYARIRDPDFRNSKDLFIHGMIDSDNGGTCVSIPVLYVAVGRRLGYPLKHVLTKRHVFCRWDDGRGERFNVDPSANGGIGFEGDDYYRTWPAQISEDAVARGEYLKSLTPGEELAVFLECRGHCLYDTGWLPEARDAYAAVCLLMPQSGDAQGFLELADGKLAGLEARLPGRPDSRRPALSAPKRP